MIDFKDLNQRLLARAESILPDWLHGGHKSGREWVCGDINGGPGESFSVNLETGVWAEFAGQMQKGGDLISLWAAKRGLKQKEAAEELMQEMGLKASEIVPRLPKIVPIKGHKPVQTWVYTNETGLPVATVTRYNKPDGKKFFCQQSLQDGKWEFRAHPTPRPLYGLNLFKHGRPCLVVEGEKTADRARLIAGHVYDVTTWMGGTNGVNQADWSPLYGRKILICPDADGPGMLASRIIADKLHSYCPEIKIIDTTGKPDGWDLADEPDGYGWEQFKAWASPRAGLYSGGQIIQITPPKDDPDEVDVSNPDDKFILWETLGIPMTRSRAPINNLITATKAISDLKIPIWYDSFYNKIFISGREITDADKIALTISLQSTYGLSKMEVGTVGNAILHTAQTNTKNEPLDWLNSLKWDGIDRVTDFFTSYYNTPSNIYHQAVAKYFWAGLAARIINPGCQVDCMIVLQGPQGRFKSTSLSVIGGKWYASACNEVGSIEFLKSIQGILIMEIGEMSSFKKAHIEAIKNMLSTRCDRFRASYGEYPRDYPRQCIMAGSTNEDNFLSDNTGSRRFYPVSVDGCNIHLLRADRDQLFAQAVSIYKSDSNWWNVPLTEAEEQQENRRLSDPWEELIDEESITKAGLDKYNGVKITDIATKILRLDARNIDRVSSLRIAAILKRIGFRVSVKKDSDRKSHKFWSVDKSGGHIDRSGQFMASGDFDE